MVNVLRYMVNFEIVESIQDVKEPAEPTGAIIEAVHAELKDDSQLMIRLLAEQINIDTETNHTIINEYVGKNKLCVCVLFCRCWQPNKGKRAWLLFRIFFPCR